MLLKKISIALVTLLMFSAPAFAAFESRDKLFDAFAKAGIEEIIEMPGGGFSGSDPNVKVLTASNGKYVPQTLRGYAGSKFSRLKELDYVKNGGDFSLAAIVDKSELEAFQVGEIFLCYRAPLNVVESTLQRANHNPFVACYLFPMKIQDVIQQLRASIAASTGK